jgi:hypothetical protein
MSWDRPAVKNRPPQAYRMIFFPEDFANPHHRKCQIMSFASEGDADIYTRNNGFAYCETHLAYARIGSVTVRHGTRFRVVPCPGSGWWLDHAR